MRPVALRSTSACRGYAKVIRTLERIPVSVCASRIISAVDERLRSQLKLPASVHSLALFTADCDDATYIAADEATKQAQVQVVFGQSFYAGAKHGPSSTAGEVLVMLGSTSPAEAQSGLKAALSMLSETHAGPCFHWANAQKTVAFMAYTVSSCGPYLAAMAQVAEGTALAYLIAPPLESMVGLDAALKAADVQLACHFSPPSPTNYGGALLSGTVAACDAAAEAFAREVVSVACDPRRT